eukprot:GFUD01007447.1.p1 GENE.GFUD01007447.1~~GFUD01007447.1.p1  ORF type:complete len:344 (-),score=96.56 GFUD01007447.1:170-1201(-)
MSGVENMVGKMSLGGGGRVQRGGGGRVQRGGGSRVQGGWNDNRGRGGMRGRGGGWNRFDNSDNDDGNNEQQGGFGSRGGQTEGLGGPPGLRQKLQYTHSETRKEETLSGKGVRPQDEMLDQSKHQHKKNTENFTPSHEPSEMRILFSYGVSSYSRPILTRDVLCVPDVFCSPTDLSLYNQLHSELQNSGLTSHQIWSSWHGDSHLIANDRVEWSKHCPTFHMVLDKIKDYFNMDIKATRLNWYRDSTEWKPFHHDASAIKEDKAKQSNLTVAVSFGLEREAAFEHAKTKSVVSMPCPNGSMYVFARDINILWRHGILQMNPHNKVEEGRISVIAWGWADQVDA